MGRREVPAVTERRRPDHLLEPQRSFLRDTTLSVEQADGGRARFLVVAVVIGQMIDHGEKQSVCVLLCIFKREERTSSNTYSR